MKEIISNYNSVSSIEELSLENNSGLIEYSESKYSDTYSETINIPAGTKYLSEAISSLPERCIFNKGKVGCGGTTIAIESPDNYIIAVPFISLIDNKKSKHSDILGVDQYTTIKDIETYNNKSGVKKYMVTYNSLPKLIRTVGTEGFRLLVDEYHLLFTQYSFRDEAIMNVMNMYMDFDDYCFMSATPLYPDFLPEEIKDLPIINADWEEKDNITINSIQCIDVKAEASYWINRFLDNKEEGNAYFFINSVEFIKEMIASNELNNTNTRVIYSENNKKTLSIQRSNVNSSPKKINFITSTAFEGVDIEDEDGKVFIISDEYKAQTLTDISTSFIQISGRIRNTQYKHNITHLYSKTRYSNTVSYKDYRRSVNKDIYTSKIIINELNNLSQPTRAAIDKLNANIAYISRKTTGKFFIDTNKLKLSLYNYKISKHLYSSTDNLINEYISFGFTVIKHTSTRQYHNQNERSNRMTFKEKVQFLDESKYYKKRLKYITNETIEKVEEIIKKEPWIDKAIKLLGFDGIEKMNYHVTNIKRKLITLTDNTKHHKIVELLDIEDIKEGKFYTNERLEKAIAKAYTEAGSTRIPKASNIRNYFNTKYTQRRINGTPKWGYTLISKKTVYVK